MIIIQEENLRAYAMCYMFMYIEEVYMYMYACI